MQSRRSNKHNYTFRFTISGEARLRQARDWFFKNYFADNWGDAMRMAAPGTEGGTNFMSQLLGASLRSTELWTPTR